MRKKNELRDIYQGDSHDLEKDFTPQVTQEIIEQRQRDLRHTRIASLFFGSLALVVAIILISFLIRGFIGEQYASKKVSQKKTAFIPRHTLPSEAVWVMDYQRTASPIDPNKDVVEPPLSTQWVKKAAHHIVMGEQALALQKIGSALEHFQEVFAIYPEIEGLHRTLGILYIQREEYEKAADHLESALQEEELFDVVNHLGTAYIGTEEYEQAETSLRRALELQPESPLSHKNLAVLYRKMEQDDSAIFHFEKYIDLRPGDVDTLQTYALYLTKLARWKQAATFLTTLTQEVTDVAPLYFLLAQAQVQNDKQDEAMAALQRGIQLIDPDLAMAWMSRKEFNDVRESREFKSLVDELKIADVSLDDAR